MERTYYEVLGIEPGARPKRIKAAFRRLAKRYHPDTNRGDPAAEKKFQEILEAYRLLSSPEKRALYDAELAQRPQRTQGEKRAKAPPEPRPGIADRVWAFLRALLGILDVPDRPPPAGRPASTRPPPKGKRAAGRASSPPFEEVLSTVRHENRTLYRKCEDGVIRKTSKATPSARPAGHHAGMGARYRAVGLLLIFFTAWWGTFSR